MAEQGIVSPIFDGTAKAVVGPAWVAQLAALSPVLRFVKCSIGGPCTSTLLARGAEAYAHEGLAMQWLLEFNLVPQTPDAPNALPDRPTRHGTLKVNHFAQRWTDAALAALDSVPAAHLPTAVFIGNEPNLQAAAQTIGSGHVIPYLRPGDTPDPLKPSAMAPETYFSLLFYAAWRIKARYPLIAIYPAPLSLVASFRTSMTDGWIGDYYATGMRSLLDHGLKPPYPWQGFAANVEGIVPHAYAQYVAYGASHLKGAWGISGPTIIPEWGVPAANIDIAAMTDTWHNLNDICASMSFFQAQTKTPGILTDYGCFDYHYAGGEFMPGTPTAWLPALQQILGAV